MGFCFFFTLAACVLAAAAQRCHQCGAHELENVFAALCVLALVCAVMVYLYERDGYSGRIINV